MYKLVIVLYVVCFGLYVLFSREPDYFDGEVIPAVIHFAADSAHAKPVPRATFEMIGVHYSVNADYTFRQFKEGETVHVIYENAQPEKAAIYAIWGYWIRWQELLASVVLLVVGLRGAMAITSNPDPNVKDEAEFPRRKKRKYS
ncbi:hypothetical protein [Deminuibacter soli]|uniref:DUF3592 domain-containing protein n=1 Tax=Deminuibacter soli TaxID=2291815 RepID=A0A3E1NGI5_9BACT|nr:hypothetical protein [Deminuibacter soli]RFM27076.1 hypothetical protein DXN05_16550 [Deminuibacter soli]